MDLRDIVSGLMSAMDVIKLASNAVLRERHCPPRCMWERELRFVVKALRGVVK